ncbi:hypothetical protein [Massilia niastensis]|uniref:hypothetical protein n=1 Tax=Massilia niastensis TaxID=544911 RepID=UPI00039D43DB|nr:hypothetical protein [Massilia niastensis]
MRGKEAPGAQGYRPVNCGFYDMLEAAATKRTPVALEVAEVASASTTRLACIRDLYSRDGVEYAALDNGEIIRLDTLIAVDGVAADDFS